MALSVRRPGFLPSVLARVERARESVFSASDSLSQRLRPVADALFQFALTQQEYNRRLSDSADFAAKGVDRALSLLDARDLYDTKTVSGDYIVEPGIRMVYADASSGVVTITLPSAPTYPGRAVAIKKVDSTLNHVLCAGPAAQLLDGESEQPLELQYEVLDWRSDGSDWNVT